MLERKYQGQLIELMSKMCEDLQQESDMQVAARCKMEIGITLKDERDAVSHQCTTCQRYLEQIEGIRECIEKYAKDM